MIYWDFTEICFFLQLTTKNLVVAFALLLVVVGATSMIVFLLKVQDEEKGNYPNIATCRWSVTTLPWTCRNLHWFYILKFWTKRGSKVFFFQWCCLHVTQCWWEQLRIYQTTLTKNATTTRNQPNLFNQILQNTTTTTTTTTLSPQLSTQPAHGKNNLSIPPQHQ